MGSALGFGFYRGHRKGDGDKELNISQMFQETIRSFLMQWLKRGRAWGRLFPGATPENLACALYGGARS